MKRKGKRLGRPPLKTGRHERVNMTLPPDVLEFLRTTGDGNASGNIARLVREEMARQSQS
jgi:uncharacterized protein (DUF4415 family)